MDNNQFKFRQASLGDIPTLLELEQAVVEAERPFNSSIKEVGATYYDLEDLITSENACLIIVEDKSKIIGTGYSQIRPSKRSLNHEYHGYLGFMYVDPEYRGKGVNKKVMDLLIDWTKDKGISDFYLDVYAQNTSAIKAYEKVGFEPCLLEMKLHLGKD